jgi:diaminohydroxyphosphoribosylaminopyrimidine deaminase/5-amino-6-(5-phosphoribosylamino)uracil reductase
LIVREIESPEDLIFGIFCKMNLDEKYMALALKLAEKGKGRTSPNPLVGAVIVQRGRIVGKGYHKRAGEPHAEINALRDAGSKVKGSTLYLNLEPCSHYGRTPPCTESIIKSGIKKVVVALKDPNPLVKGKGIKKLCSAGIEVKLGILRKQALRLNEAYIKYVTTGKPFIILKTAASLDGKIATSQGNSKWITGESTRKYTHRLRREMAGILVGIGTVLADDPSLTVSSKVNQREPVKIIVDTKLRTPLKAKVLNRPTIIATTKSASPKRISALGKKGAKVLIIEEKEGKVNLRKLMKELGRLGITNLMVEGGAEINTSFLKENLVDKVLFFLAPKIIGGRKSSVGELGISKIRDVLHLSSLTFKRFANDILIEGYIKRQ